MSNKMALPDLGKLDELAKVHAASYASPHHFTMSVNGLREVVAALQLPAGNKMALDALTAAKYPLELYHAYGWTDRAGVRAQVDAAIAALQAEPPQPNMPYLPEFSPHIANQCHQMAGLPDMPEKLTWAQLHKFAEVVWNKCADVHCRAFASREIDLHVAFSAGLHAALPATPPKD